MPLIAFGTANRTARRKSKEPGRKGARATESRHLWSMRHDRTGDKWDPSNASIEPRNRSKTRKRTTLCAATRHRSRMSQDATPRTSRNANQRSRRRTQTRSTGRPAELRRHTPALSTREEHCAGQAHACFLLLEYPSCYGDEHTHRAPETGSGLHCETPSLHASAHT